MFIKKLAHKMGGVLAVVFLFPSFRHFQIAFHWLVPGANIRDRSIDSSFLSVMQKLFYYVNRTCQEEKQGSSSGEMTCTKAEDTTLMSGASQAVEIQCKEHLRVRGSRRHSWMPKAGRI